MAGRSLECAHDYEVVQHGAADRWAMRARGVGSRESEVDAVKVQAGDQHAKRVVVSGRHGQPRPVRQALEQETHTEIGAVVGGRSVTDRLS